MQQPKTIVRFYRVFSLDGDTLWVVSKIVEGRHLAGLTAQNILRLHKHLLSPGLTHSQCKYSRDSHLVQVRIWFASWQGWAWPDDQPIVSYLPFRPNWRNANKHAFHVHTPLSLSLHLISSDRAKTSLASTDHPWGTRGEEGNREEQVVQREPVQDGARAPEPSSQLICSSHSAAALALALASS